MQAVNVLMIDSEVTWRGGEGQLYLLPLDFGSQLLWLVELRAGAAPRARFLASMGSTEITRAIPDAGVRDGDHALTAGHFAAGRWNDFETDPARIEAVRTVELEWPR